MNVNGPQSPPTPGVAPHTVDLVQADLAGRKAMGIAKYGVAHQADNGRDHLVDAYQEALDLAVYLRGEIEKRKRETQDASYERWLDETARSCLNCGSCSGAPCGGCQAGGVCDAMPCRCFDGERDDDRDEAQGLDDLDAEGDLP